MASFSSSYIATKLHANVKGVAARGGASLAEVCDHLIVFGGADREAVHYQDMVLYKPAVSSKFEHLNVKCENIPMPRSGHAVASYGKFMFLFGGLDYPEEAVYNDLYLFSIDNNEWYYVGESGLEVAARSGHSLGIVSGSNASGEVKHYLVVYGGASPEQGPLGDTTYAEIPSDPNSIDLETFSVEWKSLSQTSTSPGERESHGTCTSGGKMFISGGKKGTETHSFFNDVWSLSVTDTPASDNSDPLIWTSLPHLALPEPRCIHGMCAVQDTLYVFGGFNGDFSGELLSVSLSDTPNSSWSVVPVNKPIEGRVGLSMCAVSPTTVERLTKTSTIYSPLFRNQNLGESSNNSGIIIFGGATAEKELGDIWLIVNVLQ